MAWRSFRSICFQSAFFYESSMQWNADCETDPTQSWWRLSPALRLSTRCSMSLTCKTFNVVPQIVVVTAGSMDKMITIQFPFPFAKERQRHGSDGACHRSKIAYVNYPRESAFSFMDYRYRQTWHMSYDEWNQDKRLCAGRQNISLEL